MKMVYYTGASHAGASYRDAYETCLESMMRLPSSMLVSVPVDVPSVVAQAQRALPEIRALRPEIANDSPRFDLARFDDLEPRVLALGYAHSLYLAASAPADQHESLWSAAAAMHRSLSSSAAAFAGRGLMDAQLLRDLKGALGSRNLALDLIVLAGSLRDIWDLIAHEVIVRLSDLDAAERLADQLLLRIAARTWGSAALIDYEDIRKRAFAWFVQVYDYALLVTKIVRKRHAEANVTLTAVSDGTSGVESQLRVQADR
jgi:hypothetical protein